MDYAALAELARPALITAAARRSTLTYKELARAIGLDPDIPPAHHLGRVLDVVTNRCLDGGEPSLAVMVVNGKTGRPGHGFRAGSHSHLAELEQCFKYWAL